MIDIRKLKELVRLMVANELTELDLRDSEEQVTLRRGATAGSGAMTHLAGAAPQTPTVAFSPGAAADASTSPAVAAAGSDVAGEDDGLHRIVSPMVGTFFSAPTPDAEPFVTVSTAVGPETVVCIVEAMKIFNEIRAECSGTIERVLVKNGEAIEFGQPLFSVRPA